MKTAIRLCSFILGSVLLSACQPGEKGAEEGAPEDRSAVPTETAARHVDPRVTPELWPQTASPFAEDPALEARISDLLARMTLEEKVGQIIQADINSVTPEQARDYNLGSVLNGGNSAPRGDNYAAPGAWLELADAFYYASTDTSDGGVGIPLLWGTDAVHGHNNIVGATIFPHNIGLGAARNPELIRRLGEITALEVRVTGQDWTFAPTLAVAQDDRWGRTYESYSENPEVVAAYAEAMVLGLQGAPGEADFLTGAHVLATAKHYVGDGGTQSGVDQGDNRTGEADLARIHGAGYPPAIEAGVLSVMASFNTWNGDKLHGHEGLLSDILVGRLGFGGFVVGDWNGHGQVPGCTPTSCPQAFNAGVDMYMAPDSWEELYANTLDQVRSGEIPMARLDEAVSRILRVKFRTGLMDAPAPSLRAFAGEFERLGAPEHRAAARQAVRESLVLLKNENAVLPISASADLLVVGAAADDIGMQTGGWTINWQGEGNEKTDFPGGQSILDGLREAVEGQGGRVRYSPNGEFQVQPDVAILVFGEQPYAEFIGDRPHLDFASEDGLIALRRLQAAGVPTVAVFLSGRPMWANPELNASDAFVAAWLPGSEGGGVADVLIGDSSGAPRHDFKGRLPMSWPARPDQGPLNIGDADYDPLFPYDFGGSYADPPASLGVLSEAEAVGEALGGETPIFTAGRPVSGVTLNLIGLGGEVVRVAGPRLALSDGALTATAEDWRAQEDTRRLVWSDEAAAQLWAGQGELDVSAPDLALSILFSADAVHENEVMLRLNFGEESAAEFDIGPRLRVAEGKEWRETVLPMRCFRERGLGDRVNTMEIRSGAGLDLVLAEVKLVSAPGLTDCEF